MVNNRLIDFLRKKSVYPYLFLCIIVLFMPFLLSGYNLYILFYLAVWLLLTESLNLFAGYMGYPLLGHAAFYAIGAYTYALIDVYLKFPQFLSFTLVFVVSGVAAFMVSIPFLKLRGTQFAIGSLSFTLIVWQLIVNLHDITGGTSGLRGISQLFNSGVHYAFVTILLNISLLLIIKKIVDSHFGEVLSAIREDEDLAENFGIDVTWYKRLTFVIVSIVAGLSGCLFVSYLGYTSSDYFSLDTSFLMLMAAMIGGMRTLIGPLLGTLILIGIPEILRPLLNVRPSIFGIILIVIILFCPYGIAGLMKRLVKRLR